MAHTLYITATEARSGKSAIALGLMQLVLGRVRRPAVFRPIITSPDPTRPDHDIELLRSCFHLDTPYADTFACTLEEARELINEGQSAVLMDKILRAYKSLEARYDFILCEGTDFMGKDAAFEYDLNADIAANLGAPVLLVTSGVDRNAREAQSAIQSGLDLMADKGVQVVAVMVNMATMNEADAHALQARFAPTPPGENTPDPDEDAPPLVFVLPALAALGKPSIRDVARWLKAAVIHGNDHLGALVDNEVVAAMQVGNFLDYLQDGSLVITPGDRADILLASLAARLSSAYPDIAGVLLTGGIPLPPSVHRLIQGWPALPLPVLAVREATLPTVQALGELHGRIEPDDERKIHTALGHFERHVDIEALGRRIVAPSPRTTPLMFQFQIMEQARRRRMRIVLPEGGEDRILRAADILLQRGVADIILLGDADRIGLRVRDLGLDLEKARILQPELSPDFEDYAVTYHELRKHKGVSLDEARERMTDATYFGTMMVYKGQADGLVSGSINTTAHTVRPALEFIKTKPGYSIVSSVFFMCLKDRVLTFGDCAINPDPTAAELADIAVNSAETSRIFGLEPRVAMLSYSTGASGRGADVDKVAEATRLARAHAPDLLLTGPIQYDAAIDPETARTKMPGDPVAGRATVFIFPDLNTGNNTYKAVQRAAGAVAIGPVLQGLRKPVNDLSRGATVPDIVNTVAITAVQAQAADDNQESA